MTLGQIIAEFLEDSGLQDGRSIATDLIEMLADRGYLIYVPCRVEFMAGEQCSRPENHEGGHA